MAFRIRQAVRSDIEWLLRLDPLANEQNSRRMKIVHAVLAQECWVATEEGEPGVPIGYGCLEKSFFEEWFISLIVVSKTRRRVGIARQMIAHLERHASAKKVFTSTNTSNAAMRQLLVQAGYQPSGKIENLDPGDAELVFVKIFGE